MLDTMVRVAINGYGRIGRMAHRVILERFGNELEIVGINAGSSTDIQGWMYLLQYDSVYRPILDHTFKVTTPEEKASPVQTTAKFLGYVVVDNKEIPFFSDRDPKNLPWKDLDVDIVIESTGAFTKAEDLEQHIQAGAKSVILSAPFKGETTKPTYVLGVNLQRNDSNAHDTIVSNASCTTNCITPVAHIIEKNLGIEKAMMTTIHAYTSDQKLHDGGHKDHRRARAAAMNIVPTSTGATQAAAKAIPSLEGIFNGLSIRVPVPVGSLSDFTFLTKQDTTVEEITQMFENAAKEPQFQGILQVTHDPIVSSDIIGNSHSSIVDLSLTQVVGGNMVKVIAWYDNEYGYTNRLVEETLVIGKLHQSA